MADIENSNSKKGKSGTSNMIFEVNEEDCSPTNSDEDESQLVSLPESRDNDNSSDANLENTVHSTNKTNNLTNKISQTDEVFTEMNKLIEELKQENNELSKKLDVANQERQTMCNSSSCITIKFKDKRVTNLYSKKVIDFIKSLFVHSEINTYSDHEFGVSEITTSNNNVNVDALTTPDVPINNHKKRRKRSCSPDGEDLLFIEDAVPSEDVKPMLNVKYSVNFDVIQETVDGPKPKARRMFNAECWNCGGAHSLRDCKEPRDMNKINAGRKRFNDSKSMSSRYHLEDEQRFGHLAPGKISDKLRRALDLRPNELPTHIYRMRTMGYPPGWLEEMLDTSSELDLYNFEGKVDTTCIQKKKFNPEKVVEYPGFNVPIEKGYTDDYKHYKCPQYSNRHGVHAMLDYLSKMHQKTVDDDTKVCDMDVDDKSIQMLDNDHSMVQTIKQEPDETRAKSKSPSLVDLEIQKNQLLAELENGSVTNSPKCEVKIEPCTPKKESNVSSAKMVVASAFGTPILKSSSPYSSLPKSENFAKDVSEMINFENLPDSTGKYDQMIVVLEKVRNVLKQNSTKKS